MAFGKISGVVTAIATPVAENGAPDLDRAVKLLALPRTIGKHPDDGEDIIAGVGRFGPYVKHGKTYANLDAGEDILSVGINRAITLIAEKRANPGKGRRFGADPGRLLGEHPQKGGPVTVKNGRYGPYVTNNGVNATLPSDKTPETITLDEAIVLLDARAERTGGGPTSRRKRPARKEPAKKAAPPKTPEKAKKRAAAGGAKAKSTRKAKAEAAE